MKIRKTTDEKGNIVIEMKKINDGWINIEGEKEKINQELTNTEAWNYGIFTTEPTKHFHYGEYTKTFEFSNTFDPSATAEQLAKTLENRISQVRSWVAECKAKAHTETAEILTTNEVVERLQDENRLLYRNKAGQIKSLDI